MIENIEELPFHPQLHAFAERKPFREIEVAPEKIGPAQGVAAESSKLASLRRVATSASSRARINARRERIGIEPLNRPGLSDAWNRIVLIKRHSRHHASKLRSRALHDSVSIRRISRAQHRKRNPAVPERRPRNLPAIQRISPAAAAHFDR